MNGILSITVLSPLIGVAAIMLLRAFAKPDDPAGAALYYFRASPRFEVADGPYAYLNNLVCVTKSRTGDGGVIHRVFAIR